MRGRSAAMAAGRKSKQQQQRQYISDTLDQMSNPSRLHKNTTLSLQLYCLDMQNALRT